MPLSRSVLWVLLAGLLSACGTGAHAAGPTYPRLSERAAIAATVKGFPSGTFVHLALGPPATHLTVENRLEMTATVNAASSSKADQARASWKGCLADGALSAYLTRESNALGTAVQGTVYVRLPNGSTKNGWGCGSDVKSGQVFGAQLDHASDAAIVTSVRHTLAGLGVTPTRIDVLHPLGPAIDVTVSIRNIKTAGLLGQRVESALNAKPLMYEGVFLEVDDPRGRPVEAGGDASRAGVGGVWGPPGSGDFPEQPPATRSTKPSTTG